MAFYTLMLTIVAEAVSGGIVCNVDTTEFRWLRSSLLNSGSLFNLFFNIPIVLNKINSDLISGKKNTQIFRNNRKIK